MLKFQQLITIDIFNRLIKVRNKFFPERKRDKTFRIALVLLFLIQILISYLIILNFKIKMMFFTVLIAIILFFVAPSKLDLRQFSKIPFYLMYIISVSFLITGIITKTKGYIVYSLIFSLIMPTLVVIFGNIEREELYTRISESLTIIFGIVTIISFFIAPILNAQYSAIFGNPNAFSNFLSIVLITQLYLLEKKNGRKRIVHFAFSAMSIALCLYTSSRTGMLSMVLILITYLVYLIFNKKIEVKDNLIKISTIALLSYFSFFFLFYLFTQGTETVLNIEKKCFGDSFTVTAPLYTPKAEDANIVDATDRIVARLEKGASGKSSFTSGRVDIWRSFIKDVGIVGHRTENKLVSKKFYSEPKWCYAHNAFLQLAYSSGVFAGISLLAIWCIYGIKALKEKLQTKESMMFLAFAFASGLQMMLGSNYSPYHEITQLVTWIVMTSAFKKNLQ